MSEVKSGGYSSIDEVARGYYAGYQAGLDAAKQGGGDHYSRNAGDYHAMALREARAAGVPISVGDIMLTATNVHLLDDASMPMV